MNDVNIYQLNDADRRAQGIISLPGSLTGALRELEQDSALKAALGAQIYEAYHRAKWAEVEEYRTIVTDWEIDRYLENRLKMLR